MEYEQGQTVYMSEAMYNVGKREGQTNISFLRICLKNAKMSEWVSEGQVWSKRSYTLKKKQVSHLELSDVS